MLWQTVIESIVIVPKNAHHSLEVELELELELKLKLKLVLEPADCSAPRPAIGEHGELGGTANILWIAAGRVGHPGWSMSMDMV
ncbi:hypothetical protein AWZ03_012281 [Drosophila navojoa]|uniref:Uncharacterized protein n=1 Tax=Drosophila navojoa TaxID=7232 RepID=A0A484AXH0_DRONA|nr:hypothetical protein AWZ03_012281 [Drosophila navojoa]